MRFISAQVREKSNRHLKHLINESKNDIELQNKSIHDYDSRQRIKVER